MSPPPIRRARATAGTLPLLQAQLRERLARGPVEARLQATS